jgi:hypothetical protein
MLNHSGIFDLYLSIYPGLPILNVVVWKQELYYKFESTSIVPIIY